MYYMDPDGNRLESQVDNFDSAEEATAFVRSASFRENPVGVDFDPEELAHRVRSGEDEASDLHYRAKPAYQQSGPGGWRTPRPILASPLGHLMRFSVVLTLQVRPLTRLQAFLNRRGGPRVNRATR
jgi:hypothetical protein